MKKIGPILGIIAVFFVGMAVLLYPTLSNWLYERNSSRLIQEYGEMVQALPPYDKEEQLRLAKEYNDALTGYDVKDPFIPGSGIVLPDNYTSVLDIGGVMATVEIPKIGVNLPVRHGTSEWALQRGVGHIEATAFPVGGTGNHCVLTGHRGLSEAKLFTDLDKLEAGDLFLIHIMEDTLCYQVDDIRVVEPEEVGSLRPWPGEDYCTLITCTPYAVNSHRLLVRGDENPLLAGESTRGTAGEAGAESHRLARTDCDGLCSAVGPVSVSVRYPGAPEKPLPELAVSMQKEGKTMKFLQEAAAFLLAALLTLGLAMAAYSAESDPSQRASVTIHKLLVEEGKTLAVDQDGREITDPGGLYVYQNDGKTTLKDLKGLNGVGFTLTRVRDGTASVNNTVKHTGADAYENTLTTARVGGRDGIAKFDNLPHGVYLVEEIKSGDYKAGTVKFLLQVPLPDPTGSGEYIYDIHVYPKNTGGPGDGTRSKEFTKEVGKRTGNDVTWEFKWNIPDGIADGESLTLTDELDDRLTYKSVSVGYQNRSGSDKTLATRYYEVNYDKRDHTVAITLKDDGFAELAKALLPESGKKTPTLIIRLNTTIKSNATGTIKNSGVLEYTDGDGKTTTETPKKDPTVDVENGEGSLTIYKYDDKTKEPLSGAQFKLYTSRSDALADRNAVRISGDTTGSDGYLLIEGLEYEGKGTSYWLMETKAPVVGDKQYQLLPAPMEVRVGPSSHLRSNWVEVPNNVDLTKGNDGPPDGPGSPYGGGAGRWPFTLAGLLLIAWSAGMLARWRRNGMK